MLPDEIKRRLEHALMCNSLAIVLADAADTFHVDADNELDLLGCPFKQERKKQFSTMRSAIKNAKAATYAVAKNLYDDEDADAGAHDSDWWHNLMKLILDRVGEDPIKTHMLLEFLDRMPSLGRFKVGLETFQKL